MVGPSFSKIAVSTLLIFSLLAQNLVYAGGPGGGRSLEDPLLAGYLVSPGVERARKTGEDRLLKERPDLELATLSSVASEADLEVESRPESLLAPLSVEATTFLDRYSLTADHLRERDISFADFQRLFDTDTSLLWNWARVVAINRVIPHALEAPFRGGRPIWPEGGMTPIHRPSKRTIPAFLDAFTAFTYENLERVFKITILAFLILDFREANSFSSAVSLLWGNEEHTVNHLLSFFQTAPGPYILGAGLALPFVWGGMHGAIMARHVRRDASSQRIPQLGDEDLLTSKSSRFKGFADQVTAQPQTAWSHYGLPFFMWFVPFKEDPIAEHLGEMVATLRWNGRVTAEEGRDIFRAVQAVSTQRGIAGLMATDQLLEIMHGVNFKDFKYLLEKPGTLTEDEKDRLLMVLEIKTQALTHLKGLADLKAQWAGRHSLPEGLERILKGLYCKSLLWYGGQSGGWDDLSAWAVRGFMLGLKGIKTWLLVNLLTALVNALVEFAHCPNEFKDLEQGEIGPISNTLECFNEYVRIFNQIPGQPVETLRDLIPNVAFPNNQYELDLSNKGIDAATLVQILNAFQQNGIKLTSMDLSGNLGKNSTISQDYQDLGEAISQFPMLSSLSFASNGLGVYDRISPFLEGWSSDHANLTSLDLSGNFFGHFEDSETITLGNALKNFPKLTSLDISNNVIGLTGDEGTTALGVGLQFLPQLTYLSLEINLIGFTGDAGTNALGDAFFYLPRLTYLELGNNFIGKTGDAGTVSLGKGLVYLQNLAYLSFGEPWNNFSSFTNDSVALKMRLRRTYPNFGVNNKTNTKEIISKKGLVPFQNLPFVKHGNFIGLTATNGTIAIGEALNKLSHLTYLDFSNNYIGMTGNEGLLSIAAGFSGTPNLETFLFLPQSAFLTPTAVISLNTGLQNTKAGPLPFMLLTEDDVKNYVTNLSHDTAEINLSGHLSNPSSAMIQLLFENIRSHSLRITRLLLSNTGIGSTSSSVAIGKGIQLLSELTYLDLSNNSIGLLEDSGAISIAQALKTLTQLIYLDLSHNFIGLTAEEGVISIGEVLEILLQLQYVALGSNPIGLTGDAGTAALGNGLRFLSNLTYLDLSNSFIGFTGNTGTVAIGKGLQSLSLSTLNLSDNWVGYTGDTGTVSLGEGLQNKTALTTLNLSGNFLGQYGSQGLEILLQNVVREGLNLNLAGAVGIPWTVGAQALATLNAGPVAAACYQQRCFGDTSPQNTTTVQSVDVQRMLAVEEISAVEEEGMGAEESRPSFLTRWGQNARSFVTHATTSTKQTVQSYWDAFGTWLTNTLTDAAHEVVTNSPSYFPNGNNPNVRDWPSGNVFFNTTSVASLAPALPAVPFPALP